MDWSRLFLDMGPSLGFGGVAGLTVGFVAKKVTKMAAIGLGLTFILIQTLVYYRLITVDWGEVEARATGLLIDSHGSPVTERLWHIITANLSFGGAFAVGFAIGFKKG